MQEKKYLSSDELAKLLKITKGGIYYKIKNQNFPKPIRGCNRSVFYDIEEIRTYYKTFGFKFDLKKGVIKT